MRRYYLIAFLLAAAMAVPAGASATTLPVKPLAESESGITLIGDGQESRHRRSYPGAHFDIPLGYGNRFDMHPGHPRAGFALQRPGIVRGDGLRFPDYRPEPPAVTVAPEGQAQY